MGRQWHQLHHMQIICTSHQRDNHPITQFLEAECWRPTNSVKAEGKSVYMEDLRKPSASHINLKNGP